MNRVSRRSFHYLFICLIVFHIGVVGYLFSRQINSAQANERVVPKAQVLAVSSVKFAETTNAPSSNKIFEAINQVRIENGLSPLKPNAKLAEVALARAKDMADRGYYAHKNPDGKYYYDFLKDGFSSGSSYSCENLDLNFTLSADIYVSDWLKSDKGHRDCMLEDRVTDAGYAVAVIDKLSGEQTAYVVVAIHSQVN